MSPEEEPAASRPAESRDSSTSTTITRASHLLTRALSLTGEINHFRTLVKRREGGTHDKGVGVFIRSVQTEVEELRKCLQLSSPDAAPFDSAPATCGAVPIGSAPVDATPCDATSIHATSIDATPDTTSPDSQRSQEEEKKLARLRTLVQCTNVNGMEAKWNVVKRCEGLVSMMTTFSYLDTPKNQRGSNVRTGTRKTRLGMPSDSTGWVMVDAVVDSGAGWVRICGDNERRVVMQMAESGWAEEDIDEQEVGGARDVEDDEPIFVLRIAAQMVRAARRNRFRYAPPRVHIVMPRVEEGKVRLLDYLLQRIRSLGGDDVHVTVDCANTSLLQTPPPSLSQATANLLAIDNLGPLTDPLNLDCSILVALTSDITHQRVESEAWHSAQLATQIVRENQAPGEVLRTLLETIGDRRMVCSADTAAHFLGIVYQIGREREVQRASCLLPRSFVEEWRKGNIELATRPGREGLELVASEDGEVLLGKMREMSIHHIPDGMKLPVAVVGERDSSHQMSRTHEAVAAAVERGELPRGAVVIAKELRQPNLSTFMYGWASGLTTYTSNGEIERMFPRVFEEHRETSLEAGPKIAVSMANRALASTPRPEGPLRPYRQRESTSVSSRV